MTSLRDDIRQEISNGNLKDIFKTSDVTNLKRINDICYINNNEHKVSSVRERLSNHSTGPGEREGETVRRGGKCLYNKHEGRGVYSLCSGNEVINVHDSMQTNKKPENVSTFITKDQIAKEFVTIGKNMNIENYEIKHHKHILAVWAAGTAANNSTKFRFSVEFGKKLLLLGSNINCENGFIEHIEEVRSLTTQESFDAWHHSTISAMIDSEKVEQLVIEQNIASGKNLNSENYSYGIAAKLLNVYLKVYFLGEFSKKAFADYIHPPIDRLLLEQLQKLDRKRFSFIMEDFKGHKLTNGIPAWTQLTFNQYEDIIRRVKSHIEEQNVIGLWKIEYAWKGHQ